MPAADFAIWITTFFVSYRPLFNEKKEMPLEGLLLGAAIGSR
jgi:hypothetical protein